jgi:hypothetical protein
MKYLCFSLMLYVATFSNPPAVFAQANPSSMTAPLVPIVDLVLNGDQSAPPVNQPVVPIDSVRQFTFNHSLWEHSSNVNSVTGYWVGALANASGTSYAWSGQFGQLSYHALPPTPQLGSSNTLPLWDDTNQNAANYVENFADVELDNFIIMPDNFGQTNATVHPQYLADAYRVIDYVANTHPAAPIIIYQHWPELRNASYPPTAQQISDYYQFQLGDYHDWFINYQNAIIQGRESATIRMIPVGSILADIFTNANLQASQMSWQDLYFDNDPHGTQNLYFLAGLIVYQALFGQQVVATYVPPAEIDSRIRNQFTELNQFVWQRLRYYQDNQVQIWE